MSGQELRKIMNLMESVAISESKTYNILFTDHNDGEDRLISFASQEDAEIYSAVEAGMDEGSIYSGMETTEYVDEVAEKIVPAGFLAEFAEAAFAEEFDDDVFYEVMDKLEGFFQPYSRPEDLEEASGIHGMDLDALLWQIFEYGGKYRTVSPNGGVFNKAKELIERLLDIYGPSVPRKEIAEQDITEAKKPSKYEIEAINFIPAMFHPRNGPMTGVNARELADPSLLDAEVKKVIMKIATNLGSEYRDYDKAYDAITESKAVYDAVRQYVIQFFKVNVAESAVMETGNANAQQKGINFKGTPAVKNKGDMNLSSPKSKPTGGKTPLAQQKAGTNVGKIKS